MRLPGLSAATAFWWAAGLLAIFRLWLAIALPITGDEAYFYWWGVKPDWGYYDHPPMVGWWLAALLPVSHAIGWLRLPAVLLPFVIAWLAWQWVRLARPAHEDSERAWWAALVVLLAPAHVWNVLVTTDTPMIFFALLAVACYLRGLLGRGGAGWMIAAGLALSLAFLAKYFAVFLAFAFFVHIAFARRDRRRWADLAILVACALPGPLFNLWWNSAHCWNNVLFNFFNRGERSSPGGFANPFYYAATFVYLLGPYAVWTVWRARAGLLAAWRGGGIAAALLWISGVPLALFALVALGNTVGVHWPLAFVPPLLVAIVLVAPAAVLPRLTLWGAALALIHVVLFVALLAAPFALFRDTKYFDSMVLAFRVPQVIAPVEKLLAGDEQFTLASDGYSNAATLGYHLRRYVAVFGPGSKYARQDDTLTDWQALEGKNIAIYRKTPLTPNEYTPLFASVVIEQFVIEGVTFSLIKGYGFNYAAYRDSVLRVARDRWYRLPAWLPDRGCVFCEKYFPGEPRPLRTQSTSDARK